MRKVNVGALKAQLSAHIQYVRGGEEVLVCDRNRPVARIVPVERPGRAEQEKELIARGVLVPPSKGRASSAWPKPPGKISDKAMETVLREERDGR